MTFGRCQLPSEWQFPDVHFNNTSVLRVDKCKHLQLILDSNVELMLNILDTKFMGN